MKSLGMWICCSLVGFGWLPAAAGEQSLALLEVEPATAPQHRQADRDRLARLRAALARDPALRLLGLEAQRAYFAEPPDPQAATLSRKAREELAAGRRHSTRLKPDLAIQEFSAALRNLRAVFPSLPDLHDLEEAHLQRGMTYQALGQAEAARREYRMVLLLDPDRKLDEALVNPVVVERFEQVRAELLTSLKGSVSLLSTPAGARVLMDGRPVGRTPITIPGVLPGEHYFSVQHPGYRTWFGVLSVPAGGLEKQELYLTEGQSIGRWRGLQRLAAGEASAEQAAALVRGLGVDRVLLAAFSHPGGQTMLKLSACDRQGDSETLGVFPLGGERLEELAVSLRRYLAGDRTALAGPRVVGSLADGAKAGGSSRPPPAPPAAGPAWYERWWVWTLVGVVAAGAAATTGVLLGTRDSGIRLEVYR